MMKCLEKNELHFCTLFDSNYLDKGLAMWNSLKENENNAFLFILAMDDVSFRILNELKMSDVQIIGIEELLEYSPEFKECRDRKTSEFCWSCTALLLEHILLCKGVNQCVYLDADLFFYSSPKEIVFQCSEDVGIMEHRFPEGLYYKMLQKDSGKYCVEFNLFKNNDNSLKVLNWWKNKCLNQCDEYSGGDQKYLEGFCELTDSIHIWNDPRAGIAPWNISDYYLCEDKLYYKGIFIDEPIFFHFAGMVYINDNEVNTQIADSTSETVEFFYLRYLEKIQKVREKLNDEYGLAFEKKSFDKQENDKKRFFRELFRSIKKGHIILAFSMIKERMEISVASKTRFGENIIVRF